MRVLLIGHDPAVLRITTKFLRDEDFLVDAVDNAAYGIFRCSNWEYDLILLDVSSPGFDARSVLISLQRQERTCPLLILTGHDGPDDVSMPPDGGSHDRLLKPFTRVELVSKARKLMRQPVVESHSTIEIGAVQINTKSRTVVVNQNKVALTAKEYCLLEFLAVRRGKTVRRTEIYEHLFDVFDSKLPNLLDVYVSNIRRKIGSALIVTLRSVGYRVPEDVNDIEQTAEINQVRLASHSCQS